MIRTVSLALVLALPVATFAQTMQVLKDISGHRYEENIRYAYDKEFVNGYPDDTYRPDTTINRVELVKILMAARFPGELAACDVKNLKKFSDAEQDAWYAPHLCVAVERNIVAGYADGTFKPASTVNVAEAAKIIAGTYGIVEEAGEGAMWYVPYVEALKKFSSYPPTAASVSGGLTRGEMAFAIHHLETSDAPGAQKGCIKGGCSGQLCVEEGDDGVSTCEWREEYACYATAKCERQDSGNCGWTMTEELQECLGM